MTPRPPTTAAVAADLAEDCVADPVTAVYTRRNQPHILVDLPGLGPPCFNPPSSGSPSTSKDNFRVPLFIQPGHSFAQILGALLLLPNFRNNKPLVLRWALGCWNLERRLVSHSVSLDVVPLHAYREGLVARQTGALLLAVELVPRDRNSEHHNRRLHTTHATAHAVASASEQNEKINGHRRLPLRIQVR